MDGYWNSREQSFLQHLIRLMTSWAVVVDVWFLDQQRIRPGESAADFATRIQRMVAARAGETKEKGAPERNNCCDTMSGPTQSAIARPRLAAVAVHSLACRWLYHSRGFPLASYDTLSCLCLSVRLPPWLRSAWLGLLCLRVQGSRRWIGTAT